MTNSSWIKSPTCLLSISGKKTVVLTDRQQLNCLLCFDSWLMAWLARREELRHLPPQVGEILKFRRLWDGSNISDRDAIVLVWDDGARTCEHAFLFTTTSSFSAALIFCACARAHAYTPTLDRVLESRLDGLLVAPASTSSHSNHDSNIQVRRSIGKNRSACKNEFAYELIRLG